MKKKLELWAQTPDKEWGKREEEEDDLRFADDVEGRKDSEKCPVSGNNL
jgi:hypothetical protein